MSLLTELDVKSFIIPINWCDNTSVVVLTENLLQHSKMENMELDLYFLKEKIQSGRVIVNFLPASDQVGDILTKPHTKRVFIHFKKKNIE